MAPKPTPAAELIELARRIEREAARLDAARVELRGDVRSTHGRWEGLVAERFRAHTGARYRQKHFDIAHDRLLAVARQLRREAESGPVVRPMGGQPTGGALAP